MRLREPVSRWCPNCGRFVTVDLWFSRYVFPEHRHGAVGVIGEAEK